MNLDWDSLQRKMEFDKSLDDFEQAVEDYNAAEAEWLYWLELALLEQWRKAHLN